MSSYVGGAMEGTALNLCAACHRWKGGPEDRYCAWCAAPLIIPVVDAAELSFEVSLGCERVLTLKNDGSNSMLAALTLCGSAQAISRFRISPESADNLYDIPAGGHQPITFHFDFTKVDASIDYSVTLSVDTNAPNETLTVQLKVARPPVALLLPSRESQAEFVYGDPAALPLRIRNDGGGVLRIVSAQIDEPRTAAGSYPFVLEISKGSEATVDVPLELDKLKAGDYIARGSIVFTNHAPVEYTRNFRVQRPPRMRFEPAILSLNVYPIARRDRQALELRNLGDETLLIEQIKSNARWLSTLCKNLEIPPKQRTFVDVFVDGDGLTVGLHTTEMEIVSNSYGGTVVIPIRVLVHQPRVLPDPIGVDFGTSLSCVATVRDGDPVMVDINPEDLSESVEGFGLPSVVFFEDNFVPLVGKTAKTRAEIDPSAAVQSVKRLLGSKRNLKIRGKEFTPSEITVEIFRTLLGAVERSVIDRGSPRNVILTVPADISDDQIREVLLAAATAGLDVSEGRAQEYILDEPSAAALYYLWKLRKQPGQVGEEIVFIYDFGAGTLDCSLVSIMRGTIMTKIRVLATTGDRQLGGDDVDLAIAQHLARSMKYENGFDGFPILCSRAELNRLKDHEQIRARDTRSKFCLIAERLKIQLSDGDHAKVGFPLAPTGSVSLTTVELEDILQPFLLSSNNVIAGCCKQAGVLPADVNTVLHTGRGSALAILRARVNGFFSQAIDRSEFIKAKQCVAMGAAWWAYIKNLPGIDIEFEGLCPKLPHSIGYRAVENFGSVFKPIFEAGQSYPDERLITFHCVAGHKFELDIIERRFGIEERTRSRGTVRLSATASDEDYKCEFRLTPQRTLEVLIADHRLEIDPQEDEDSQASQEASNHAQVF